MLKLKMSIFMTAFFLFVVKSTGIRSHGASRLMCLFEKEQMDALCGIAPMTQKIFEEVLMICDMSEDLDGYLAIWNSFPQAARCYAQRLDSEEG